jgi:hypothetical protein
MKKANDQGLEIVEIDTIWTKLPKSFYELRPTTYRDGTAFCCLFGDAPEQGVFGSGSSPEEAVHDWDCHLNELLHHEKNDSELMRQIRACRDFR